MTQAITTPNKKITPVKELPTDYFIIFNDDTTKRVSMLQAEMLMQLSGTAAKFIKIDGALINFSNIARVVSVKEYFEQFPDERPPSYEKPNYMLETGVIGKRLIFSSEERLEKAIIGWERQRNDPGFVVVTGGLDRLIAEGNERLERIKKENRAKRLEEIRASRKENNSFPQVDNIQHIHS